MRSVLRFLVLPAMAGLLLMVVSGQARAGSISPVTFGLSSSPGPAFPGGLVTVDVFLSESSGIVLSDVGIIAATFTVDFSNATLASPVDTNAGFDLVTITENPGSVLFDLLTLGDPVTSEPSTPDQLYLGTMYLMAADSGSVSVSVQVAYPGQDNIVAEDGTVLDAGLGSPSISIAIVPEPASVVMLSAGAFAGLGLIGYRRRHAA